MNRLLLTKEDGTLQFFARNTCSLRRQEQGDPILGIFAFGHFLVHDWMNFRLLGDSVLWAVYSLQE
jgi:hypothetical protein